MKGPKDWHHICRKRVWAKTDKDKCERCGKERPSEEPGMALPKVRDSKTKDN